MLPEIIAFLIQAEPAIQQLVLELIQIIRDNAAGKATAAEAEAAAQKAYSLMLAHLRNPSADEAAVNATVDEAAKKKFGA